MSRRQHAGLDGKGADARNSAGHDTVPSGTYGTPGHALLTSTSEEISRATAALSDLCMRDDGYIRLIPDGDGKTLWAKFKYTRGAFRQHYVLARVYAGDWPTAILLLARKVLEVQQGIRRPTADTRYTE